MLAVLSRLVGASEDLATTDADAAAVRPVTVYLHLRADGSIDLEGSGTITQATAAELLPGATSRSVRSWT